ncbi:hypothetical protein [Burkholderia stabilis]|uniref:hypothetical protein n=1 Tax=Burkholderia stabilis TaxID=95485 RepID=UPI00158D9738|nr:hypothetical protein [Burkholderia stabilis]
MKDAMRTEGAAGRGREGRPASANWRVAADGIDACTRIFMQRRQAQELRAYPVFKRGWMKFAGRPGPPGGQGGDAQGFVLKGFFAVFAWFLRCCAAPKIHLASLLEFVKTRPYN